MNKSKNSFNRIEKKYRLSPEQVRPFKHLIQSRLTLDEYGPHSIHSLYLDDERDYWVQRSMDKPVFKEKLRLRLYSECLQTIAKGQPLFLEAKKKYNGIVYKRRSLLTYEAYCQLLREQSVQNQEDQMMRELVWQIQHDRLIPRFYLYYVREAYSEPDSDSLRVTMDHGIAYQLDVSSFEEVSAPKPLLEDEGVIVEIKVQDALPLWLVRGLSDLQIYPASFSKVGESYLKERRGTRDV